MANRYEISIDEIVLDGLELADVASFRSALAASLTRLARNHNGGWASGEAPLLHGAAVPVPPAGPAALGASVAGSVWQAIAPPATEPVVGGAR